MAMSVTTTSSLTTSPPTPQYTFPATSTPETTSPGSETYVLSDYSSGVSPVTSQGNSFPNEDTKDLSATTHISTVSVGPTDSTMPTISSELSYLTAPSDASKGPPTSVLTTTPSTTAYFIQLSLQVDAFSSEASWNLEQNGEYYFSENQSFEHAYEEVSLSLWLSGDWSLVLFDRYGDGGISASVMVDDVIVLVVDPSSYTYQGSFLIVSEPDASTVPTTVECPFNCSTIGTCNQTTLQCDCPDSRFGYGCQHQHCPGRNEDCDLSAACITYCSGRGTCDFSTGDCECEMEFCGWACEIVYCGTDEVGNPCYDRGSCDYDIGECTCNEGFYGDSCEFIECPEADLGVACSNQGTCDPTTGVCDCDPGYWGANCLYLTCPMGDNGQVCSGHGDPSTSTNGVAGCDGYLGTCSCFSDWENDDGHLLFHGYTGDNCSIPICYSLSETQECSGNGRCDNGECRCDEVAGYPIFAGKGCHIPVDIDECVLALHDCSSKSASCRNSFGSFTCTCGSGTFGDGVECTSCDENASSAAGSTEATDCLCNAGYSGDGYTVCEPVCSGCSSGVCIYPDVCQCPDQMYFSLVSNDCELDFCSLRPLPCHGHGNCTNSLSTYYCSCFDGYTGDFCEAPICEGDCSGHGTCAAPDICECDCNDKGDCWSTLDHCASPLCTSVSNCTDHGSCLSPGVCQCDSRYTGNDCSLLKCPNDCSGHGTLTFASEGVYGCVGGTGECVCTAGFTGEDCSDLDESASHRCPFDCSGVGTCLKPSYACECPETHFGVGCENRHCPGYEDDCNVSAKCSTYCTQNGVCDHDYGNCLCEDGVCGTACEIVLCGLDESGSMCSGRGSCDYSTGICECIDGYLGSMCEFIDCPTNDEGFVCSLNGSCDYTQGLCECSNGYFGENCIYLDCPSDEDGNICSSNGSLFVGTSGVEGCDGLTGECHCFSGYRLNEQGDLLYHGYSGDVCEVSMCPTAYASLQCSGHGVCGDDGVCSCLELDSEPLYIGEACQTMNPDVVPNGEEVVKLVSTFTVTGASWDELEEDTCSELEEAIALELGLPVSSVTLSQCNENLSSQVTPLISTAPPPSAFIKSASLSPEAIPPRRLSTLTLDFAVAFVSSQSIPTMSSAKEFSVSVRANTAALESSVSTVLSNSGFSSATGVSFINATVPCPGNCNENGVCEYLTGECGCYEGYLGFDCKIPTCFEEYHLLDNPTQSIFEGCNFHGECISPDVCSCYSGYSGDRCEAVSCPVDDSTGFACHGNGACVTPDTCTCYDSNSNSTCVDTLSYCSELVDLCSSRVEVREKCVFTCAEEVGAHAFSELASCIEISAFPVLYYTGDKCQHVACSGCTGHGWCFEPWECICESGYDGDHCEKISCLQTNTGEVCSGHGTCLTPGVCSCEDGWTAADCSVPDCADCAEVFPLSSSHFTCTAPYAGNSSVCVCEDGWSGESCSTPRCDDSLCLSCELPDICAMCIQPDRTGSSCEYVVDCPLSEAGPCHGNGGCFEPSVCTCEDTQFGTYLGDECEIVDCSAVDDCSGHGTCVSPNKCSCQRNDLGRAMYAGDTCVAPVCAKDTAGNTCSSRGSCASPFQCNCNFGFMGDDCGQDVCEDLVCDDEGYVCARVAATDATCEPICSCGEFGTCAVGSIACVCEEGYYGAQCLSSIPLSAALGSLDVLVPPSGFTVDLQLQVRNGLAATLLVPDEDVRVSYSGVSAKRGSETSLTVSATFSAYGVSTEGVDSLSGATAVEMTSHVGLEVLSVAPLTQWTPAGPASSVSMSTSMSSASKPAESMSTSTPSGSKPSESMSTSTPSEPMPSEPMSTSMPSASMSLALTSEGRSDVDTDVDTDDVETDVTIGDDGSEDIGMSAISSPWLYVGCAGVFCIIVVATIKTSSRHARALAPARKGDLESCDWGTPSEDVRPRPGCVPPRGTLGAEECTWDAAPTYVDQGYDLGHRGSPLASPRLPPLSSPSAKRAKKTKSRKPPAFRNLVHPM
eukprot:Rmarinus@m.6909